MLNKLICYLMGHKRRVRVKGAPDQLRCPRCGDLKPTTVKAPA